MSSSRASIPPVRRLCWRAGRLPCQTTRGGFNQPLGWVTSPVLVVPPLVRTTGGGGYILVSCGCRLCPLEHRGHMGNCHRGHVPGPE